MTLKGWWRRLHSVQFGAGKYRCAGTVQRVSRSVPLQEGTAFLRSYCVVS